MIRECPSCRERLSWLEKFRTSGWWRARPVTPCPRCGEPVRRSAVATVSRAAALALLAVLVVELVRGTSNELALLALALAVITFATGLATTLHVVRGED